MGDGAGAAGGRGGLGGGDRDGGEGTMLAAGSRSWEVAELAPAGAADAAGLADGVPMGLLMLLSLVAAGVERGPAPVDAVA